MTCEVIVVPPLGTASLERPTMLGAVIVMLLPWGMVVLLVMMRPLMVIQTMEYGPGQLMEMTPHLMKLSKQTTSPIARPSLTWPAVLLQAA